MTVSNLPAYLVAIQEDVSQIIEATNNAAEIIENSHAYINRGNPFHAAAVSTYNTLVSVLVSVESYQAGEVSA